MKNYVIIGNGIAAAGVIEGIRSKDTENMITVLSGEKYPVYGRPLISYLLEGKTDLEHIGYRPDDFYEKNGCTVLYGKRAVRILPEEKKVLLDDGADVLYDVLCNVTGSVPFVPPFEGLDTVEKKFSFMTLDDAKALAENLSAESRVLIVGAGLIGLKCAEGIIGRAGSITVCDLAPHVMPSVLDAEAGEIVKTHLEAKGIRLLLADTAVRFEGGKAVMRSGEEIDFDVLVLAVGVRPCTNLVKEAGGAVVRGITVDAGMHTTIPDVYAAGDCVESYDITADTVRILATLPNAYMQGYCAGVNMAGGEEIFDKSLPMNSMGILGLHLMSAGTYTDETAGGEVYIEKTETSLKKLFMKDGRLMGFILVGDVERAGIYTKLIREKIALDTVDFEMLKKNPGLFPFSAIERKKMLGGAK